MADEINMENQYPLNNVTESVVIANDKISVDNQLLSQLEPFKNLSLTTTESKKEIWSQFVTIWCEILQYPASEVRLSYEECARLLPMLTKATDFYTLKKSVDIARKNCFICIDQLNYLHIKTYLLLPREELELPENHIYYKHVYYLLYISSQTALYIPFETIDDQKYVDEHVPLLIFLIERVERTMPSNSPTMIEKNHSLGEINNRILSLLWNLSDRTNLIPILLKCDLPKRVIHWLSQAPILTEKNRKPFISLIHNMARHDDGADELNKYDAIQAIKQYQHLKLEKEDSRLLIISMALALLSTPEQIKSDKKGMNNVLNQLLQLVLDASKADRYRFDGIHLSEPLGVLVKMFVVEERTLDYILSHAETEPPSDSTSTIHLFISLLLLFSNDLNQSNRLEQFTLIALVNIFWSISFQTIYSQQLINNQTFIDKIQTFIQENSEQNIIEQYKPRAMENIKQASFGILHNLNIHFNKQDQHKFNQLKPIENKTTKPLVMISYSHENNQFCDQILHLLEKRQDLFEIWIDRTHCQGVIDLWESIADGIERAAIVLSLLSNQYFESKSCRQEFIYATDSLKKRIIPILIQNFEPKGWLGIRMTGMKYIRFKEIDQLDKNKINELLNTIILSISSSSSSNSIDQLTHLPTQHHQIQLPPILNLTNSNSPTHHSVEEKVSNNNANDINKWFEQNQISIKIRDLYEFQSIDEMIDYGQLLNREREKQMNIYGKIFSQKYSGTDMPPHQFLRFANALEILTKQKSSSYPIEKTDSPPINKSSTCTIL